MSPVESGGDPRREAVAAIEQARLALGLRAGTMARRAGITPSWWSAVTKGTKTRGDQVEKANASVDSLIAAARVVGNEPEVRRILNLPPLASPPRTADGSGAAVAPSSERLEREERIFEAYQKGFEAGWRAARSESPERPRHDEAG